MSRVWERTTAAGDTITLLVDEVGVAVSIRRIWGAREGYTLSHREFVDEWLPWVEEHFDDAADEVRAAVEDGRAESDNLDDIIP